MLIRLNARQATPTAAKAGPIVFHSWTMAPAIYSLIMFVTATIFIFILSRRHTVDPAAARA